MDVDEDEDEEEVVVFCTVHPRVTPGVLGGTVCGGLHVFEELNISSHPW